MSFQAGICEVYEITPFVNHCLIETTGCHSSAPENKIAHDSSVACNPVRCGVFSQSVVAKAVTHTHNMKTGVHLYLQVSCPVRSCLLQFKACTLVTQLHLLLLLVQLKVPICRVKSICSLQQLGVWNNNEDADVPLYTFTMSSRVPPCCVCTVLAGFHSQSIPTAAAEVQFGWWRNSRTSGS